MVRLILQVVPDESFVYPKSDLCLKTLSMLSRSMSVILRSSIRTFETKCYVFFINYPKHRCMGFVIKFLSPYLNGFYFLSRRGYLDLLVLGKGIPLVYVSNTYSFPLFCLI